MILDMADTIVFKDLEGFFANTNYKNLKVIGLTATPYSGNVNGIEAYALEMMKYQVYRNNITIKVEDPQVHVRVNLGELSKWKKLLEQYRVNQPMLIYATG
jgi:hypothetical protein